ncbi:MxaS protein [Burkholderia sp. KK1]|nr:MxaS protein [Burkholderia sp. KK1]
MNDPVEFHYRLPGRAKGFRPGSHPGSSFGAGQEFAMHARLFDHPDPRRLDLRASQRAVPPQWLVRLHLQRVAVPLQVVADVSESMHFGAGRTKLDRAADFVEALGYSAFRAGDQVGMLAFDHRVREDLYMPPRHGRAVGDDMAAALRGVVSSPQNTHDGTVLVRTLDRLAGRHGLVFLVSDFHWPLALLDAALHHLVSARVVPIVIWDPAETEPPDTGRFLPVRDMETGGKRVLWLRARVIERWRANVAARRAELKQAFGRHGAYPFFVEGAFDADALSRHFLETTE